MEGGQRIAALELEDCWNHLAADVPFELLCGYPMGVFERHGDAAAFRRLCTQHTAVTPSERYTLLPDHDQQQRMVARLQHEVLTLRSELAAPRLA